LHCIIYLIYDVDLEVSGLGAVFSYAMLIITKMLTLL